MNDTSRICGYVRVSTEDQSHALQVDALRGAGVNIDRDLFSDTISGSTMKRPGLKYLLRHLRAGDTLVVWKLDRLGRSLTGVLETIADIETMGIEIISVTEGFDTKTPFGRAMMQIILVFAEMERNMIAERTKAGMKAKRDADPSWRPGRKHTVLDYPKRLERFHDLFNASFLHEDGSRMSLRQICYELQEADPKAPISDRTNWFSNWKRVNFKGYHPQKDENLNLNDDEQ